MREIKFRAWDEKRKRMFTPYSQNFGVTIAQKNFFVGINSNGLEVSEYEGKGYWRILPVMQYTGLKDTNGKEIYEGDVLHTHKGNFVVTWDKYMFVLPSYYCGSNDVPYDYFSEQSEDEVIGNIYQNPELIEVST